MPIIAPDKIIPETLQNDSRLFELQVLMQELDNTLIADQLKKNIRKILSCLCWIKVNEAFIRYAIENKHDKNNAAIYPNAQDKEKGVIRDHNGIAIHLSYDDPDTAIADYHALITQIIEGYHIAKQRSLQAAFFSKFELNEQIGCMEARTARPLKFAMLLKTTTIPAFNDLIDYFDTYLNDYALDINTMTEIEVYTNAYQFFAPYLTEQVMYNNQVIKLNKEIIDAYFENVLCINKPQESDTVWQNIYPISLIQEGNALVKTFNPNLKNFNHLLAQLKDPENIRPIEKLGKDTDRTKVYRADSNRVIVRQLTGARGRSKKTTYTKKTATSLLPTHGQMWLFNGIGYDKNTIGLLFDINQCDIKPYYYFKKNIASVTKWWVGERITQNNENFISSQALKKELSRPLNPDQILPHNEILAKLQICAVKAAFTLINKKLNRLQCLAAAASAEITLNHGSITALILSAHHAPQLYSPEKMLTDLNHYFNRADLRKKIEINDDTIKYVIKHAQYIEKNTLLALLKPLFSSLSQHRPESFSDFIDLVLDHTPEIAHTFFLATYFHSIAPSKIKKMVEEKSLDLTQISLLQLSQFYLKNYWSSEKDLLAQIYSLIMGANNNPLSPAQNKIIEFIKGDIRNNSIADIYQYLKTSYPASKYDLTLTAITLYRNAKDCDITTKSWQELSAKLTKLQCLYLAIELFDSSQKAEERLAYFGNDYDIIWQLIYHYHVKFKDEVLKQKTLAIIEHYFIKGINPLLCSMKQINAERLIEKSNDLSLKNLYQKYKPQFDNPNAIDSVAFHSLANKRIGIGKHITIQNKTLAAFHRKYLFYTTITLIILSFSVPLITMAFAPPLLIGIATIIGVVLAGIAMSLMLIKQFPANGTHKFRKTLTEEDSLYLNLGLEFQGKGLNLDHKIDRIATIVKPLSTIAKDVRDTFKPRAQPTIKMGYHLYSPIAIALGLLKLTILTPLYFILRTGKAIVNQNLFSNLGHIVKNTATIAATGTTQLVAGGYFLATIPLAPVKATIHFFISLFSRNQNSHQEKLSQRVDQAYQLLERFTANKPRLDSNKRQTYGKVFLELCHDIHRQQQKLCAAQPLNKRQIITNESRFYEKITPVRNAAPSMDERDLKHIQKYLALFKPAPIKLIEKPASSTDVELKALTEHSPLLINQ